MSNVQYPRAVVPAFLAASLQLFVCPSLQAASLQLTGEVAYVPDGSGQVVVDSFNHSTTVFVSDTATGSGSGPGATGSASINQAELDWNLFRAATVSTATTSDPNKGFHMESRVSSTIQDIVTVTPALSSLNGTAGTWVISLGISGVLAATDPVLADGYDNASSSWNVVLATELSPELTFLGGSYGATSGYFGDPLGTTTISLPVTLGVGTFFEMQFAIKSAVTRPVGFSTMPLGTSTTSAMFSNTFQWLGTAQVLDSEGNPIDFTLQSESGTDWTVAAVPLPGALGLLASGVLGLGVAWRRRGGRPAAHEPH